MQNTTNLSDWELRIPVPLIFILYLPSLQICHLGPIFCFFPCQLWSPSALSAGFFGYQQRSWIHSSKNGNSNEDNENLFQLFSPLDLNMHVQVGMNVNIFISIPYVPVKVPLCHVDMKSSRNECEYIHKYTLCACVLNTLWTQKPL